MNTARLFVALSLFLVSFLLCSCSSSSSEQTVGLEKAKYAVLEKEGDFEIRQYAPQIVAETLVQAGFDDAGNIAFRRLYDYISGNNRTKESIAMTAPVEQRKSSEKIAMTAPVEQVKTSDGYIVSFLMPGKYTMDKLPEPLDRNVRLTATPARKIAAIRYSGTWSRRRYEQKRELLKKFIADRGLCVTGEDIFARYDPPFQLWFLRRNEVLIPVE
jgi:hypothetical protein